MLNFAYLTSFQKNYIGWPQQPPTEKILKFNLKGYGALVLRLADEVVEATKGGLKSKFLPQSKRLLAPLEIV